MSSNHHHHRRAQELRSKMDNFGYFQSQETFTTYTQTDSETATNDTGTNGSSLPPHHSQQTAGEVEDRHFGNPGINSNARLSQEQLFAKMLQDSSDMFTRKFNFEDSQNQEGLGQGSDDEDLPKKMAPPNQVSHVKRHAADFVRPGGGGGWEGGGGLSSRRSVDNSRTGRSGTAGSSMDQSSHTNYRSVTSETQTRSTGGVPVNEKGKPEPSFHAKVDDLCVELNRSGNNIMDKNDLLHDSNNEFFFPASSPNMMMMLGEDDNDTIASDITGLTGVFSTKQDFMLDADWDFDDTDMDLAVQKQMAYDSKAAAAAAYAYPTSVQVIPTPPQPPSSQPQQQLQQQQLAHPVVAQVAAVPNTPRPAPQQPVAVVIPTPKRAVASPQARAQANTPSPQGQRRILANHQFQQQQSPRQYQQQQQGFQQQQRQQLYQQQQQLQQKQPALQRQPYSPKQTPTPSRSTSSKILMSQNSSAGGSSHGGRFPPTHILATRPQSRTGSYHGPPRTKQSGVFFTTVQIRHYERILSDNPSAVSGPSIGIGWRFRQDPAYKIVDYERYRGMPRGATAILLNREQRENLLLSLGYTRKHLAAAVRANTRAKNQRRQTIHNLRSERMEEAVQGARLSFRKIFTLGGGGGNSAQQQQQQQQYHHHHQQQQYHHHQQQQHGRYPPQFERHKY